MDINILIHIQKMINFNHIKTNISYYFFINFIKFYLYGKF